MLRAGCDFGVYTWGMTNFGKQLKVGGGGTGQGAGAGLGERSLIGRGHGLVV